MYNILELRSKSQDELLRIAQELGVKKASNLAHDALIYAILDQHSHFGRQKRRQTTQKTACTYNQNCSNRRGWYWCN